ncbi:uncharacterized protein STEHIDRAFT_163628 [Stereum hirsutum FP-91666 SS1]|uniref:DUF4100 domain-containing protein n=1 Tax=Stereum hirsutum (strain FP-91666) TaxID=721885 RepID=R7RX93_STEHR|nr:uncharacterized protein STEHIDRAFT_163628 [Stereum hirsutum FP-91666 SS1]EIM79438.1 hypothetical protein STEHIDRAFT_163628 [Stereum hirsutum FP-91666 SS1]
MSNTGSSSNTGSAASQTPGLSTAVAVVRYMPIPHSKDAPLFTGKFVTDFLNIVKAHGKAAGVPEDDLPPLIAQYCSDEVKAVLRYSDQLKKGARWSEAEEHMLSLYGADDEPPPVQPSTVISFCGQTSVLEAFSTRYELEQYYRRFHAMSSQLINKKLWTIIEANLWFYRGLPRTHRVYVGDNIDQKYKVITNPPPITDVFKLVKTTFDPDQIDVTWIAPPANAPSFGIDGSSVPQPVQQRTVRFEDQQTQPQVQQAPPNDVDNLAEQLKNLKIQMAQLISGSSTRQGNISNDTTNATLPQQDFERRCFMCGQIGQHRLGLQFCPETQKLVSEGMIVQDQNTRRYTLPNGVDLPIAPRGFLGGLAAYLRSTFKTLTGMFAKAPAQPLARDPPPHQAAAISSLSNPIVGSTSSVGLTLSGSDEPILQGDVFALSANDPSPRVYYSDAVDYDSNPVTRSGKDTAGRDNANPYRRPDPAKSSVNNPAPVQNTTNRPAVPGPSGVSFAPSQPAGRPQAPRPNIPPAAPPVPTINTQPPPRKPPVQTQSQDADMKDAAKKGPLFHFTSDIQEKTSIEKIEQAIWAQSITLSIGELVGASPALQKRLTAATTTRRQYTNAHGEYELYTPRAEEILSEHQTASLIAPGDQLYVSDERELSSFLVTHTHAVQLRPSRFFAMTTGQFSATLAGRPVKFMVDTGSELNLIPEWLVNETGIPLDFEGSKWALKGVHGGPVRLLGCVKDVDIVVGGHNLAHHFFVQATGTGDPGKFDVILGQPWIQWFATRIDYDRSGAMFMTIWKDGDRSQPPTLSITLAKPHHEKNMDKIGSAASVLPADHSYSPSGSYPSSTTTSSLPLDPRIVEVFDSAEDQDFRERAGPSQQP